MHCDQDALFAIARPFLQQARDGRVERRVETCDPVVPLGGADARIGEAPVHPAHRVQRARERGAGFATRAAAFFKGRGMDLDWIERGVAMRESTPIRARITAIASPTDAVVGHAATFDHHSPDVRHVDIDASHLGLCFNPTVWKLIADTLNRPEPATAP